MKEFPTDKKSSLPLYRSSHTFQNLSPTGARILKINGLTVTKSTPLDKYLSRSEDDISSWYSFICKQRKVPVISGGSLCASWPLTEDYCKSILLLHWPNWRNLSEIKSDDISWSDKLQEFLLNDSCPNFVKADIERAKLRDNSVNLFDEENVDDGGDDEQLEWVDLVQPCADFHVNSEFKYDDGGADYDWSSSQCQYPDYLGVNFLII